MIWLKAPYIFVQWLNLKAATRDEALEKYEALQVVRAGICLVSLLFFGLTLVFQDKLLGCLLWVHTWIWLLIWLLGRMEVHKERYIKDKLAE